MADMKHIKFQKADGIARLTLDRPKHNVLNIDMMKELIQVLQNQLADDSLKCLVILGAGRSWCAGVDVGEHKPEMADEMIATFNRIFEIMDQMEFPIIAAVHGAALGGGMELAIASDIIVASKSASFGQPEIKLGFLPPYAAIRLPHLIGPAKSIEVCTTGKIYSAEQAQTMGMISVLTDDDAFSECVDNYIKEIAACSPLIIRLNKRGVKNHLGMDFKGALSGVSDLFLKTLMKTEDTLEGISSFYEKRKPEWRNR